MCKERKYASYKVVVTRNNGEREEISFEGVTGSDFKAMREAYNDYKEEVAPDSDIINIDFCGVSKDGKMNVMWNKPYEKKDKNKEDKELNEIESMINNIKKIQEYSKTYKDRESYYNKKQDDILHDIENIPILNLSEEEFNNRLINFGKEIIDVRNKRRETKNRNNALMYLTNNYDFNKMLNRFEEANKKYTKIFDEKGIEKMRKSETIAYENEEDKINKISNLKNMGYDTVVDLGDGKIGYYEKCLNGNSSKINNNIKKVNKVNTNKLKPSQLFDKNLLTLDANTIISCEAKITRTKGSSMNVIYHTEKEKIFIMKNLQKKYKKIEIDESKKCLKLMYRIA